jgi:poly(A) polymerase
VRAGRVVFIGDAQTRIREDHLRILRFFRFNAWYGRGAPDAAGLAACAALSGGVATLSAERVWKEIRKLLEAEDPRAAVAAMAESGVLAAALPEAGALTRFSTLVEIETSQLFTHDAMTRLAALTPDEDAGRRLAARLKLSTEERERLQGALGRAGERIVSFLSPRDVRRHLYRLGPQTFCDRVLLAWAGDTSMIRSTQWRALLAMANGYQRPKLPLTGDEVLAAGVAAGPKVGAVMREVEAWWIDADFTDDKLSIVERLKAVAQGLA